MKKEMIVKWKIKEEAFEQVLELLPQLVDDSRNEEGNIFYNIYRSANDPNELILHECYTDEQALQTHRTSDHFKKTVVEKVLPVLDKREVIFIERLF